MKWIKASERLPEINGDIVWRYPRYKNYISVGYKSAFGFIKDKESVKSYNHIEWLDESPDTTADELAECLRFYLEIIEHVCQPSMLKDLHDEEYWIKANAALAKYDAEKKQFKHRNL